ncbi:hypothetical protein ACF07S_10150 [Streptomyces sp. NPDC016640]|uniref:hypothetical protein n=1 Tax=Streptomyces sp. NPDC016640 TaxID=3364969 RepID=UPI0036FF5775
MTTTAAAAAQANVTVATIRTWCRRGVIAATKTAGRWVINTASLAARIAIGAMKRPARQEARPVIDLTATYVHALLPGEEPRDFTVKVKERTTHDGEHLISVRGLIPLFADRFDAITDEGDRIHALTVFQSAVIVISDRADADWEGDPQARESGRLRTTYRGGAAGITVDDVLDLAAKLRTQLAA